MNAHNGHAPRLGNKTFVHGEGTNGGRHVSAIAVVVYAGLVDQHLSERVVHVRIRMARRADDTHLGERGNPTAHAVELAHVWVGRADGGEEDRFPLLARGGQVASVEDHGLGRSAAHEYRRQFLLWHGSPRASSTAAARSCKSPFSAMM